MEEGSKEGTQLVGEKYSTNGMMSSKDLMDVFVKGKGKLVNSAIVKCSLDVTYYFKIRNIDNSIDYVSSLL